MKALVTWLVKQADKDRKRPTLEHALLTNRSLGYGIYRVRYLMIRVILRAALHMLEIVLFSRVFSPEFLAPVLIVRSSTSMGLGFWWGGLEEMRRSIRALALEKAWPQIRRTIDGWLLIAAAVSLFVLCAGATWVLLTPDEYLGFSIFDTYILGCLLRFAIDMVARTYHSGMFALRRIYRPMWSLLIGDCLDVLGVVVLWPLLGPWCFGIVFAGVGIIRAAIVFLFVRQAYTISKIPHFRLSPFMRTWRRFEVRCVPLMIKHGLANATSQIDSMLIIALVTASTHNRDFMGLAIFFYVMRPFVSAGFGWARLFYFDFIKLDLVYGTFFKKRFERFLVRFAILFAVTISAFAALWVALFWRGPVNGAMVMLIPFFWIRVYYGLFQVQAFSYGQYGYLIKLAVVLGMAILAIYALPLGTPGILSAVCGIMLVGLVVIGRPESQSANAESDEKETILSVYQWLNEASKCTLSLRIGELTLDTRLVSATRVIPCFSAIVNGGHVARLTKDRVVFFETADTQPPITPDSASVACGGGIVAFEVTEFEASGRQAITSAIRKGLLVPCISTPLDGDANTSTVKENLIREFTSRFPSGTILSQNRGKLSGYSDFSEIRQIMARVRNVIGPALGNRSRQGKFDVTVFCPQGEPQLLFLINRNDSNSEERTQWRRFVDQLSLKTSIYI